MPRVTNTCGIYSIYNTITNKYYIGYARAMESRLNSHKTFLERGIHQNPHLQDSFNKHGIKNFQFEILEECEEQFLCSQEHYWCNLLNTHNNKYGYNIRPTDPHGRCIKFSPETIEKMNKARYGRPVSEKQKELFLKCIKERYEIVRAPLDYMKIIDNNTGEIYSSLREMAKIRKYSVKYLSYIIRGKVTSPKLNISYYKPASE